MKRITAFPFTSKLTYNEKGWPVLDRAADSTVLRKLMGHYFKNGVHGIGDSTCFQVTAPTDGSATVHILPGVAQIQGVTGYEESEQILELPAGDENLPRIDSVVARINDNIDFRGMYLDIVMGIPATSPEPPALTRSDSVWEIGLANLARPANSTVITNSSITDTRLDSDRCGYVTVIDRLDTSTLYAQLEQFYEEFVQRSNNTHAEWVTTMQEYLDGLQTSGNSQLQGIVEILQAFETASESDFLEWFDQIRAFVESSQNGELLLRIEAIFNEMFALVTDDDIDTIIAGTYDKEETGSLFEIMSDADVDAIVEGTYELQPEETGGIPEGGE